MKDWFKGLFSSKYNLHWGIGRDNATAWLVVDELIKYLGCNAINSLNTIKMHYPDLIKYVSKNDDYNIYENFGDSIGKIVDASEKPVMLIAVYATYQWINNIKSNDPSVNEFKEWLNLFLTALVRLDGLLSNYSMYMLGSNIEYIDSILDDFAQLKEEYEKFKRAE